MRAELSERVVVNTAELPWVVHDGCEQKILEDLPGRRTAIVRVPPGARVPGTGMLDIVSLDEPVYVRSEASTMPPMRGTLFVKQRPSSSRSSLAIDLANVMYVPTETRGLTEAPLYEDVHGIVVLLRFEPGTRVATHAHRDGEELFVLDGELRDEHGVYGRHTWVRQPPGSTHSVEAPVGCLTLTFAYHLTSR